MGGQANIYYLFLRSYRDIARFKEFSEEVAPEKVAKAIRVIIAKTAQFEKNPLLGSPEPCDAIPNLRKLVLPYKKNGQVAFYTVTLSKF